MPTPAGERIRDLIRSEGPITWARYMQEALYHPQDGFFAHQAVVGQHHREPVGRAGAFVTSPGVSDVFGALLARFIDAAHGSLGSPDGFSVVDVGAADGSLLRQINQHLPAGARAVAVEQGAAGREGAAAHGLEVAVSVDDIPPFDGVLVANELLDNLPFHRARRVDGSIREVFVDGAGERLVERVGEPTLPLGDRPWGEWPVSPAAEGFVAGLGERLRSGYAVLIDYGFEGDEAPEPVRGYRDHRLVTAPELLEAPGETDITGPVDFAKLTEVARGSDLRTWGPFSQRSFLDRLGYRRVLDDLRRRQADLESEGSWREAIATYGARGEASMLVDPAGLGSLKVLVVGTPDVPAPPLIADAPLPRTEELRIPRI